MTDLVRRYYSEDEGLALSEYLVVLGLLIGGVIGTVLIFGQQLSLAWQNWGLWIASALGSTPT
ncbi:hypothetical protein ILP92_12955 [Maribius pontilimi]|uniref:Flp family type IVb pilin n=1 Tax=Palleronia pontilimi TaxID=1964209 RepID=A0A934IAT1_9RHOB|nr:hypothetical protein [Palleronia pontilimi]MBJ3763659.1 hypothetical protein [Palleronia pontilimi]